MELGSAYLGVEWFRCSYFSPAREAGLEQHRRLRHASIMKALSVLP